MRPIAKAGKTYSATVLGRLGTASCRQGSRRNREGRIERGETWAKMAMDDDDDDDDDEMMMMRPMKIENTGGGG